MTLSPTATPEMISPGGVEPSARAATVRPTVINPEVVFTLNLDFIQLLIPFVFLVNCCYF